MIGASSLLDVAAGIASGRVMMRVLRARVAHSHVRSNGSRVDGAGDDLLRGLRVLHQVGDDHLHRHRVVVRDASSRSR